MTHDTLTRLVPPPYFDGVAARRELTKHFNTSTSVVDARPKVLESLKRLVKLGRESARIALEVDGNGRRCAAGLSLFQDELIRLIYDYTAGFALADPTSPAEQRLTDPATRQELHTFLRTLPASRFPALAAHGALAWTNDRDQRFSAGMKTLLRGVQEGLGLDARRPAADA